MGPSEPAGAPRPLALTMGEPGGIGPDVTVSAWARRDALALPPFYCLCDPDLLAERARFPSGSIARIARVEAEDAAACVKTALPVVPLDNPVWAEPGSLDPRNAQAVVEAITRAVDNVRDGLAAGIVTNPINKKALYDTGFNYPGHTEFLGALSTTWTGIPTTPVMMMAGPELRAVPVTIHIPLKDVPHRLSSELIVETARITASDLHSRFGIARPRLAVSGLNPHAGEGGAFGDEEEAIIRPAIAALKDLGIET